MDEDSAEGAALQEAAWEVYGVAPADFVATRTRWVKELRAQKQRETATAVAALRKPSVSAAAVNALVRADDPVVDQLRDVGTRMRHAQSALDAQWLAALRGERDAVLRNWVEAAARHAPGPLTAAVEAEVRDSAVAALADEAATEAVLSGTLTRALSYSGFGEVDVSDAVARTSTGVVLTRIEGGGAEDAPALGPEEQDDDDDVDEDDEDEEQDDEDGGEDVLDDDEPDSGDPEKDVEDSSTEEGLAQLEEALAEAEELVTSARGRRRPLLEAATAAATRLSEVEAELSRLRPLLSQAEQEAESARAEDEQARAALEAADEALVAARKRRAQARTALEEAEDAG